MKSEVSFLSICLFVLGSVSACNSSESINPTPGTGPSLTTVAPTLPIENGVTVVAALPTVCPSGGTVIEVFADLKGSGQLDPADPILSQTPVCNGVNGTSFSVSQTVATPAQCPAGGVVYSVSNLDGLASAGSSSTSNSVVCNGSNGLNGVGVVFTTVPASNTQCAAGGTVIVMASDSLGSGAFSVNDSDLTSVLVCNGTAGAQGVAGPVSPFSPIAPITPCGADSSPWKEVLLCLADGNLLADFSASSSGDLTRLSFIPPGSYEDTDSSGCLFNVTSDGQGGSEVSWAAGSNQYATWAAGTYDCVANSLP